MGTPPLSRDLAYQAVKALEQARKIGKSYDFAAELIGISGSTIYHRVQTAKRLYGIVPEYIDVPELPPVPDVQHVERPRIRVKMATTDDPTPAYRIIAIGDTHQQPGMSVDRWRWIARFVLDEQPDKVVHMGDVGEFSSVSRHEPPGSLQQKIRPSFKADMESVEEALAVYRKTLGDCPIQHHACLGNHEERVRTFETGTAELEGALWPQLMDLFARYDFRVTEYRNYLGIGGVFFTHVPMTLREQPYNGKTLNPLGNDLTYSLCFAHTHRFGFLNIPKIGPDNKIQILNVGCAMPQGFYPAHNKSEQGAATWGVVSMVVQGGQIKAHRFVPMTELEERYA